MTIQLDRIALDDVGANPVKLAEAIHEQLGDRPGPVEVEVIARALDIVENPQSFPDQHRSGINYDP